MYMYAFTCFFFSCQFDFFFFSCFCYTVTEFIANILLYNIKCTSMANECMDWPIEWKWIQMTKIISQIIHHVTCFCIGRTCSVRMCVCLFIFWPKCEIFVRVWYTTTQLPQFCDKVIDFFSLTLIPFSFFFSNRAVLCVFVDHRMGLNKRREHITNKQ